MASMWNQVTTALRGKDVFAPRCNSLVWTERCTTLMVDKRHSDVQWTGRGNMVPKVEEDMISPKKNGKPLIRWLLDNGSTAHMGDMATLLPYCFNIREENTVIRALRDEEVGESRKRADVYMFFPALGGTAGVLFRDVVLLPRGEKDINT